MSFAQEASSMAKAPKQPRDRKGRFTTPAKAKLETRSRATDVSRRAGKSTRR